MTASAKQTVQIGVIGVDAGLCFIGDPCYVLHTPPPAAIGNSWDEFCRMLDSSRTGQLNFDAGQAGLGVVVRTGIGDGLYPVFATLDEEGLVSSVTIKFLDDDEDDDEE